MLNNRYQILEKYYIHPENISSLGYKDYLQDLKDIVATNEKVFIKLNPRTSYYFKMPNCGHPLKISPYAFYNKIISNQTICLCNICLMLRKTNISYSQLSGFYSSNNKNSLSRVTLRNTPITITCPDCQDETLYQDLRWVLAKIKKDKSLCKGKCYSIGSKYPNIASLWDEEKNKISIYDVPATDENLHHKKWYFKCLVCMKITGSPTTANNIINNSSKCSEHKIKKCTSFAEQAIFLSFKRCLGKYDSFINLMNKYKYEGNKEFDIYLFVHINDVHRYSIEIDGIHHKNRIQEDIEKNEYALLNNIRLTRVRDIRLKDISLKDFKNVVQRERREKEELNGIIVKLLEDLINWFTELDIVEKMLVDIKKSISNEIKFVDVLRDEKEIFLMASQSEANLLKDDLSLKDVYNQLDQIIKEKLGNFITVTEQDIKRPFVCGDCGHEWEQFVNVVIKNYRNSSGKAKGCPKCAGKDKDSNNKLRIEALILREQGLTQKEIGKILVRSQATISSWLKSKVDVS